MNLIFKKIKPINTETFKRLGTKGFLAMLQDNDAIEVCIVFKPLLCIKKGAAENAGGSITLTALTRTSKGYLKRLLGRKKALNITVTKFKLVVANVTRC